MRPDSRAPAFECRDLSIINRVYNFDILYLDTALHNPPRFDHHYHHLKHTRTSHGRHSYSAIDNSKISLSL